MPVSTVLAWTAPVIGTSAKVPTGYKTQYSIAFDVGSGVTDLTFVDTVVQPTTTAVTCTDAFLSLRAGVFLYRVRAFNASGSDSAYTTNLPSVLNTAAPLAPTAVTAGTMSTDAFPITWTAPTV